MIGRRIESEKVKKCSFFYFCFFRKHEMKKSTGTRAFTLAMCPTAKLSAPGTRARSIFRPVIIHPCPAQVSIGEASKHPGLKTGVRCLWDEETDDYAVADFENDNLFCFAIVFGVRSY